MNVLILLIWSAQIIASLIFLQAAYFKFTGSPGAVYVYSLLGLDPLGRYLVGSLNILAAVSLLIPMTALYGAALAIITVVPGIIIKAFRVGFVVEDDKGLSFGLDISVLVMCTLVLIARWPSSPLGI